MQRKKAPIPLRAVNQFIQRVASLKSSLMDTPEKLYAYAYACLFVFFNAQDVAKSLHLATHVRKPHLART
tara:strand:+ start:319 stop:528 length:210 start_codon:yes stop_codon:yes gene_type:complete